MHTCYNAAHEYRCHSPSFEDISTAAMSLGDMPEAHIATHPMIKDDLDQLEVNQRALLVALGLVYYMRLNTDYRARFVKELDKKIQNYNVKFSEAFSDEVCIKQNVCDNILNIYA